MMTTPSALQAQPLHDVASDAAGVVQQPGGSVPRKKLLAGRKAADEVAPLQHQNMAIFLGKQRGRRQAVVAPADHDDVVSRHRYTAPDPSMVLAASSPGPPITPPPGCAPAGVGGEDLLGHRCARAGEANEENRRCAVHGDVGGLPSSKKRRGQASAISFESAYQEPGVYPARRRVVASELSTACKGLKGTVVVAELVAADAQLVPDALGKGGRDGLGKNILEDLCCIAGLATTPLHASEQRAGVGVARCAD